MPANAVVRHIVTFGRVLREAGLEVGPGRVADALKGDASGLARSAAILAGLFITTMGYLAGRSGIDPIRATAAKSILLKPTK